MHRRAWLWGLLVSTVFLGCGKEAPPPNLPTVHKVTGNVVDKASGQPITAGTMQFESLASQGQVAIGEIQPDGTFSLNTFVDGHKLEGAVAGAQRATFMPRADQDQAAAIPVTLPQPFEVKEGANQFKIEVVR